MKNGAELKVAPRDNTTLEVWLGKRDWDDMHDERHYEYHVQTGRNMADSLHVVVHANNVPWSTAPCCSGC